jgi:hypothetical protein
MRMSRELDAWIAQGERDAAVDTVVEYLTTIPLCAADSFGSHPRTPAELRHCLQLFEVVPTLRNRLCELASLGSEWSVIVQHWRELEQLFMAEGGPVFGRETFMPKTHFRLCELLDRAADQRHPRCA